MIEVNKNKKPVKLFYSSYDDWFLIYQKPLLNFKEFSFFVWKPHYKYTSQYDLRKNMCLWYNGTVHHTIKVKEILNSINLNTSVLKNHDI